MKPLEIKYIDGSDLYVLEGNPRQSSTEAVNQLAALINKHGFQNPLQVYCEGPEKWTILCGNHRFAAGLKVGMKSFPCIEYRGSRNEAIGRAISDNKSNEWTKWDIPMLKDLLADVDDGQYPLGGLTGFADDEMGELFNYEKKGKKVTCPECQNEFEI